MVRRIKDWPEEDRPREKLLRQGAAALTDAELLALVLRTGDAASGTSAVDQGRLLLQQLGNLERLAAAEGADLCRVPGVGPAKAAGLQAVFELCRRLQGRALTIGAPYGCAADVYRHYQPRLGPLRKERFLALLLDVRHRLLKEICISEGSLTASIVHPREVFAPVVRESAAAVLLVHNHPSGDPTPSAEDRELTRRLAEAGRIMGVRVLDHVIVGREGYVSLAAEGLLG